MFNCLWCCQSITVYTGRTAVQTARTGTAAARGHRVHLMNSVNDRARGELVSSVKPAFVVMI